jgi:tetratricopeptide (TPR) repeat protein
MNGRATNDYTGWLLGFIFALGLGYSPPARSQPGTDREALIQQAARLYGEGDRVGAEVIYHSIIEEGARRGLRDSLTALAYHRLGTMAANDVEDSVAVVYYRSALRIRDSLFRGPHNDRAHTRVNLGTPLRFLGYPDSALHLFREANTMYEQLEQPDSINWILSLTEMSTIAVSRQDFTLASNVSYRATDLHDRVSGIDPYNSVVIYLNATASSLRHNRIEEALGYARKGLTYAHDFGHPLLIAQAYNSLGIVQREAGMVEEGKVNLDKGVEQIEGVEGAEEALATLYLNLAEYYAGEGRFGRALDYDGRARSIFKSAGIKGIKTIYCASDKVPDQLLAGGHDEHALGMVREKLACLTGVADGKLTSAYVDTVSTGLIPLIDLLGLRARIHTERDTIDAAIADYHLVLQLQNRLREAVHSGESQLYLSQNLRPFFDRVIALYYRRYRERGAEADLWSAFTLSERARAYSLLTAMQAGRNAPTPEQRRLREQRAALQRAVSLGDSSRRDELAAVTLQLDRLSFATAGPARNSLPEFSREEVLEYLSREETDLLEFHLGEDIGLLFHLNPETGLSAYPIADHDRLPQRITDWRASVREGSYRRKSLRASAVQDSLDRTFFTLGNALYAQLFPGDFRDTLHPRPRPELCIVPDGVLHYLPFAALPASPATSPYSYRSADYLGTQTKLRYAYSLGYLLQIERNGTVSDYEYTVLAFAPSFGGGEAETNERTARNILHAGRALDPLTYNTEEVRQIAELVDETTVYTGTRADRANFLQTVGQARVLHLSSHGSVDPSDPNLSFIAFSQRGDSLDRSELLYFNDLYNLPLDNELTVLSACETSLGKLAAGETTMSLASAFAAAGARSTLTTLWQVDDEATKNAIVSFYRYLTDGASRAEALSRAQEELRASDFAHPYYWAGLTLHGAAGPLELDTVLPAYIPGWTWSLVGLGVIAVLGYFFSTLNSALP